MNKKRLLIGFAFFLGLVGPLLANPLRDTVPLRDRTGDFLQDSVVNPFNLRDPNIIDKQVDYDPKTNRYYITEKIGEDYYRAPTSMTFEEYLRWKSQAQERQYFERLAGVAQKKAIDKADPFSKVDFGATQNNKLKMLLKNNGVNGRLPAVPKLDMRSMGDNLIGLIFGDPPTVDIRPQGQIDLTLGGDYRYYGNPILPTYARTTGGLLFNMDIQMNVTGKIGEKLNLNTAFNNKATFDFDNIMKINYNSNVFSEDDIIKSIEGGNVNLPLRGSLIQGSQNLFGVKTELQFGNLRLTALAAQQKNRRQNLQVQGGSQVQNFTVPIDQYDENRHFFLTHFNRNTFEGALRELPLINSQFSITKIEVWVSNERNEDKEVRQIVALTDLGETDRFANPDEVRRSGSARLDRLTGQYLPDNEANSLYPRLIADEDRTRPIGAVVNTLEREYNLVQGRDFIKKSAKRLQPSEYTFNPKLGTISLNNIDRQQVVGVSFTYFYNGQGPFQVGEFAENSPVTEGTDTNSQNRVVFVKMLKSTIQLPKIPLFDLMMKNIYSVGAYVSNPQDFRLDVLYQDPGADDPNNPGQDKAEKRTLQELKERPLIRLLNLDRLNVVGDPQPDGQFDFIPDVTINTRNGRIMFPLLEPFGSSLKDTLTRAFQTKGLDPTLAEKYIYQELYDSTLFRAQERQEKNRFILKGSVKSAASNRIQLTAFGLKPGAVTVTAGAYPLVEGVDFAIDYGTSTLTILNPAYVAPNIPLNINYEDNSLFGFQTRTMLGLRADYKVNKNFNVGATYMNLFEIPYTRKVNFGDDPINNKVFGADINFTEDAPWLTKLVDKIPFIDTKEPSKVTVSAEFARMMPGHAKAINVGEDKGGSVYLDDFEGSSSPFSLMAQPNAWQIASVPQKNNLFPEANDSLIRSGVNRATLNWYRIDQFIREQSNDRNDPYVVAIGQNEVFPNRDNTNLFNSFLPTFDLRYYPNLRGPYNFDYPANDPGKSPYSAGLRGDGSLSRPETRWAGIMRGIQTTDFEAANIEYIDFWVLDPYLRPNTSENVGNLYIHLGDVSEDILRDGRKAYENGLPSSANQNLKTDRTSWGRVPRTEIPLPNSFSANDEERKQQDVGLDGLDNAGEQDLFQDYLARIQTLNPAAVAAIANDPSNDDFKYYGDYPNGTFLSERYRRFNGLEGNSQTNQGGQGLQAGTNLPDAEDVNRDNSFEENEAYFSYKIPISPSSFNPETNNYYVENTPDPSGSGRIWHHFRVPITAFTSRHGEINDFRSIRFMRIIMKDFADSITLRFAKLDLIRNQWRTYKRDVSTQGTFIGTLTDKNSIELASVNIEENSKKQPFSYVIPPGILREIIPNAFAANARQNEQALAVRFKELTPTRGRAIFKLFSSDMRVYERLKMFVHAENLEGKSRPNKLGIFMRIGSDFEKNYYEYEIPLTYSDDTNLGGISNPDASEAYKKEVWRSENTFDFPLGLLTNVKIARNASNVSLNDEWTMADPEKPRNTVKIVGNPDLGLVKGIMVGVYNRDETPQNFELWINELRMTGLNENAGNAAIARVDFKMADFGNLSVAGNYLGIGYGAIDQRVAQRSREEVLEYSLNGNFELGKFFGQKSGIRVPFNVQYSNNTRTPEFDPYDLDIKLKDKLAAENSTTERQSIKDQAQTVQVIKGYSFNNVRKDRTSADQPRPWDIANFSASYAYTQVERRDPLVESEAKDNYKGSLDYNYSRQPRYITPFKGLIKNEKVGRYFKLITDFNFNPIPNTVGFNTILDRQLNRTQYRFSGEDPAFNTFFIRRFSWDRNYNMQWDLAKALKLNFDAKSFAIIDELPDFDPTGVPIDPVLKNNFLYDNLKNFGRTKRYDQNINVNYTVPTRNIPFLDFIQIRATYGASYGWEAASQGLADVGNFINNKQNRQLNGDINFTQLYNKSKYLRKIQTPIFKPAAPRPKKGTPSVAVPKPPIPAVDSLAKGKKKKKEKDDEPSVAEKVAIRPFLLLRSARINYQEQFNSYVPGFLPQARQFGMSDLSKPGWDYVLGWQQADNGWLDEAGTRNWISRDVRQVRPTLNNYTQTLDARLSIEPFQDFRVDLDMTKNFIKNGSQEFRDTAGTGNLYHTNQFEDGSYTISYFALNSLFKPIDEVFKTFLDNRPIVSQSLNPNGDPYPDAPGFKKGYGPTNQEVLVPAFLAAYTGRDVRTLGRSVLNEMPAVNWRLTYNGLAKLPRIRDVFNNISITHGYKSTLTTNSFRTSPFYNPTQQVAKRENPNDFYPQYDIPAVVITEQFAPLIGIDASMKSGATFGVNFRKSRNLALSLSDTRLQETKTSEITIKFGHRLKNVYIKFLDFDVDKKKKEQEERARRRKEAEEERLANPDGTAPKKKKEPKPKKGNDLVLNFDLSFRDDITKNNLIGPGAEVPTRGSQTLRVSPSATYTVNKRLDLRFYVDYNRIIPYVSAAFPSTTATGGFVVTFKLN